MTAADDAAILAVLNAVPNLRVFDGYVTDSDNNAKTIGAPLPYVVFFSGSDSDEAGEALDVSSGARVVTFQITYVGETREQARRVCDKQRAALNRVQLNMPAGKRLARIVDDGLGIRRDDVWTRPGGRPLFYGQDRYALGL